MSQDVVVIGAGVAGLAAAVRLAEGGAHVLVLAKGIGSTHLAPGTLDVLGYADGERVERPLDALGAFCAAHPRHPYAIVGTDGLPAAATWLAEHVAAGPLAPYAYAGGVQENMLLPTAVGTPRPSALVPVTMAGGDLRAGGVLRIVGFRALKDFHPAMCADNLSAGGMVRAESAELPFVAPGRVDLNSLALARRFDDAAFRGEIVDQLARRLGADERVGFPAVLGIRDPHAAWADLERRLSRRVFEIPTLPPSVPGMRLFATLRDALRRARGRMLLNNEVVGARLEAGRLTGLRVRVGLREVTQRARHVVLASGGFASGGLALDSRGRARDGALGLPVTGVPDGARFTEDYFAEQPMARAGVATDAHLRPLGPDGEPVYANVRVAGGSLAGAVPWREGSGDGISLLTGLRAAELILAEEGAVAPA